MFCRHFGMSIEFELVFSHPPYIPHVVYSDFLCFQSGGTDRETVGPPYFDMNTSV